MFNHKFKYIVQYINNQKNYIYKADIIQTDPSNDLAILLVVITTPIG